MQIFFIQKEEKITIFLYWFIHSNILYIRNK